MSSVSVLIERTVQPPQLSILRRILSFPAMLCGLLAALGVLTVRSRFDDPDMWWHLKTGEIIYTTHAVPVTDIFSYTTGHHAYVPHEWLSQLLLYAAYRIGGYPGLMLGLCVFTAAVLIAGYLLCRMYSGNAKVALLGGLIVWLFATGGLSLRPQMVGYLFLIVELVLIHLGRSRNPRWFLALPPLFAVWVNCHGSFFLGMIVAAIFLFSTFFNFRMGSLVAEPWHPGRRRMLALALTLSAAALFLNPAGVKQLLYPLNTLLHQPIGLSAVEEWQPIAITDPRGLALFTTLAAIVLATLIRRTDLFWHELLLLALGTWMAASHRRMAFLFGILAAPILCRLLADAWDNYIPSEDRIAPNTVVLAGSLIAIALAFPSRASLMRQVEDQSPVRAVVYIKAHPLAGPLLNEYVYGGYLIWAAPQLPVFVDGRADVFEQTGVLAEYARWASLEEPPGTLLAKYHIGLCLLRRESPLANVLPLLPNWKAVYSDSNAIIFSRSALTSRSFSGTMTDE